MLSFDDDIPSSFFLRSFEIRYIISFQFRPVKVVDLCKNNMLHSVSFCLLVSLALQAPISGFCPGIFFSELLSSTQTSSRLFQSSKRSSSVGSLEGAGSASKQQLTKKKELKTFPRYLEVECWRRLDLRPLQPVLIAVADACKQINRIVQRAMTDDVYGAAVDVDGNPLDDNIQGEVQQKLDVLCNTFFVRAFCGSSSAIHYIASEEEDVPRCCSDVMASTFSIPSF